MKILSRKDIEKIAERVVKAYADMPENAGKPLRKVEPDKLVQGLLGLRIDYRRLTDDNSMYGLTTAGKVKIPVYDDDIEDKTYCLDGKTVLIDRSLLEDEKAAGRRNFTIMHEGGHHILWSLFPEDYGLRCDSKKLYCCRPSVNTGHKITDWEEWQTNTLAASVLLPRECIERAMFMFCLGDRIQMLNRIYSPYVYDRFCDMAMFLGVSRQTLDIRMNRLGLIKEDYFGDPYAFTYI